MFVTKLFLKFSDPKFINKTMKSGMQPVSAQFMILTQNDVMWCALDGNTPAAKVQYSQQTGII